MHAWEDHFKHAPYVRFLTVDIEESLELYTHYKRLRQIHGIPTIFAFRVNTEHNPNDLLLPDWTFVGANEDALDQFIEDKLRACV